MAIVLWIGVIITAQAFQATPREHAPAVAVGLFPAIAGWGLLILGQTLTAAGIAGGERELASLALAHPEAFQAAGLHLDGLVAISQGFLLTCMIWSAASTCLIERHFGRAAVWAGVGALASFFGFVHAGSFTPAGAVYDIGWATGAPWSLGYALCALFFLGMRAWAARLPPNAG
jgi:AGZA family xanthine/uracil permease-like MFS transporter